MGEESDPYLATPSCQAVTGSEKGSPELPFLQDEPSQQGAQTGEGAGEASIDLIDAD